MSSYALLSGITTQRRQCLHQARCGWASVAALHRTWQKLYVPVCKWIGASITADAGGCLQHSADCTPWSLQVPFWAQSLQHDREVAIQRCAEITAAWLHTAGDFTVHPVRGLILLTSMSLNGSSCTSCALAGSSGVPCNVAACGVLVNPIPPVSPSNTIIQGTWPDHGAPSSTAHH
jgi:hypothetical protein